VLGGIVARVGDTVIDGSLRNRFASLHDKLNQ
jgi:F0F1-type ATP synthase delta subunit